MERITYNNNGLTGLANLGNTCFINACMQVLVHIDELNVIFDEPSIRDRLNKTSSDALIFIEYDNIRRLMWSKNCIISPSGWIKTIHNVAKHQKHTLFSDFSQNDVEEFLLFIMDCFHNSLKRKVQMTVKGDTVNTQDDIAKACFNMIKSRYESDYSEIFKTFYGIHVVNTISLSTNETIKFTPEPYFILNLPIPATREPSIYDCFDKYFEGEMMSGENAWYNENTKQKEDVIRKISCWSFPDVLVVTFKRFTNTGRKNQQLIHFPLDDLDIRNYTSGYEKDKSIYTLYGVCNHSGNVGGGHYTAYVRNVDRLWYSFNDTQVIKIEDTSKIISTYAYCLFYRKKNK